MTDALNQKKPRAPKVPRNYESIKSGALALELKDRANLVKELKASIDADVETAKQAAASAIDISAGL